MLKISLKSKGIGAERELLHMFWANKWACIRVAGSGSMIYPSPDLLAGNNLRKIAIECKITKSEYQYFTKKEIEELIEFSRLFGAESFVSVKFQGLGWKFFTLEDLKETDKKYVCSRHLAEIRGLDFNDII
ncbi:MAG: Holliday junction resolvase Hjc [Candidatus Nanoarchaeia archaeon]|nr:Holliday junction resolvase Hjc [Candidatus Nanoarchaeia archaeon]